MMKIISSQRIKIFIIFLSILFNSNVVRSAEVLNDLGIGPQPENFETDVDNVGTSHKTYFVDSSSGSDDNDGTKDDPWRSIAHSASKLKPGDTLYLREGRYNENQIKVAASGELDTRITIAGYPGERVIVDGSLTAFRDSFSDQWELVDNQLQLYKSKDKVKSSSLYIATITQGALSERLVTYYDDRKKNASGYADLVANNMWVGKNPKYAGPGIYNSKGTLYLRLSAPNIPKEIRPSIFSTDLRPDDIKLSVSAKDSIFSISGSYLNFENLTIEGAYKGFRLRKGSNNLSFSNIRISAVATGFLTDKVTENITLSYITVNGGFPSWLAWSDMKGSSKHAKPASHWLMRSTGFSSKSLKNFTLRNSQFINVFDGVVAGGEDIRIHNNLFISTDDMVQLASSASNVRISHNLVYGAGPSHNGKLDSAFPGTKYIHHNIIDARAKVLWSREDPNKLMNSNQRGVKSSIPFPRHNSKAVGNGDPWKLYNNTVLYDSTGFSTHPGYQLWSQVNDTDSAHEVYNNIFLDEGDGIFTRGLSTQQVNQRYDGNIYWSNKLEIDSMLFRRIEIDGAAALDLTLSDYKAEVVSKQGRIPVIWDQSSEFMNPMLNENFIPQRPVKMYPGVPLKKDWPNADKRHVGAIGQLP